MRLSDLGVAAKLERHFSCEAEGFAKLERRNTFVGSPAFIAPELLTGIEKGYLSSRRIVSNWMPTNQTHDKQYAWMYTSISSLQKGCQKSAGHYVGNALYSTSHS